jgi:RNA polymerase sigma factor for flagellar operon FliA
MALVLDLPLIRAAKARLHDGRQEVTTLAPVIDIRELRRRRDSSAAERLFDEHQAFALKVLKCIASPYHKDWGPLRSAALFGLWQAAQTFDATRGAKFETFASRRIRGAVLDELRSQDRLKRGARGKINRLAAAEEELTAAQARHPSLAEVAGHAGVAEHDAVVLEFFRQTPLALDDPRHRDLHEVLPAPTEDDDPAIELEHLVRTTLRGRELEAVLRFLDGEKLAPIGASWGVTESRVSQIISAAGKRLRAAARQAGLIEGDAA